MNSKILSLLAGLTITTHAALPIPNFAAADLVLGQVDFTSKLLTAPPTGTSLLLPTGVVVDPVTRKVFVADALNRRILRYADANTLTNGAPAEFVFGQLTFVAKTDYLSNSITAVGLFFDRRGRLWVADTVHHRVLMFEAASTRTNWIADKIFGQPDFATITPGTARGKMKSPYDVCVDAADRLWVADKENNRVLRFDSISGKGTGAEADGVLGQASFTTNTLVGGQSGLPSPGGVTVSASGALFVSSGGLNRVLRFDNAASLSFVANASAVLGQPDFTTTSGGTTAAKMSATGGAWITPDDSLWVTDPGNCRVLRFNNASTKPSGAAADGVLGQPDFTSKDPATTRRGLNFLEFKPFVDADGSLWLPDSTQFGGGGNNRVLRFPAPAPVVIPPVVDKTAPLLALSTKIPKLVTKPQLLLKGTASDASGIKSVQYRLGKAAFKTAKGTTTWQIKLPLKKGKNTLTLLATDTVGNVSPSKLIKITRK
jgi:sugar lactone lactonase YvrE